MLKNNKFYLLIIIFVSICSKIYFASNVYTEPDDLLVIQQIERYETLSIYDIANDKKSPTYSSDFKKKIRQIENLNNPIYDSTINFFSFVLKRIAPSKHSTLAPIQFFLFSDVITFGHSYKEIKFFSKLPSIFFSILFICVTYVFAKNIFKNQNRFLPLIPTAFVAFSYPIMNISLRAHSYSASIFAVTLFFYLIYINSTYQKKIFTVSDDKINLKSCLFIGLILSLLAHLSYVILFLSPLFFSILFFQKLIKKNFFCNYNYNLIIIGISFTIFTSPLLAHLLFLNLNEYGVTTSTAGEYYEYYLNLNSDDINLINFLKFYIQNSYLVIVKNLSFFIDANFYSNYLQICILIFFISGLALSNKFKTQDRNIRCFLNIFIIFVIYYFILVSLGHVTLGPTRHLNSFTPLLAIVVSMGIYFLLKKFKFINFNLQLIYSLIIIIFCLNLPPFYKYYKDAFDENFIANEVEASKIGMIINSSSFSHSVCIMEKVYSKTIISTCPKRNNRYSYILNMNDKHLKYLKSNNLSLGIINRKLSANELLLIQKYKFKLQKKIKNIKFIDNSPLYITKYVPNFFEMEIYK